jgi:hypothetical protein
MCLLHQPRKLCISSCVFLLEVVNRSFHTNKNQTTDALVQNDSIASVQLEYGLAFVFSCQSSWPCLALDQSKQEINLHKDQKGNNFIDPKNTYSKYSIIGIQLKRSTTPQNENNQYNRTGSLQTQPATLQLRACSSFN